MNVSAPAEPSTGSRGTGEAALLLVIAIWGANYSFIKLGLTDIPPLAFAALRFSSATIVLLWLLYWREGALRWNPAETWPAIWLGLLGNTLYQALFMFGLSRSTVTNVALLVASVPIWATIIAGLFRVERLTGPVLAGVVTGFSGVVLVVSKGGISFESRTALGDLAVLVAAVCWAGFTLGVRALRLPISNLRLTALTLVTGTPGLIILSLPELLRLRWSAVRPVAWAGLAYSTLLAIVVAYVLWNRGVRLMGGVRTAIYNCATPLVAMLVAWLLLGEAPGAMQGFGAMLIVTGVLVSRWSATPATRAM